MKPICFMVMPFLTKPVTNAREGAPAAVDFDRLWDAAFLPAISDLGYLPMRADMEPGTVIIKDMLNRLRHADLVIADVSVPNGNVYYELGIRHVANETHCVTVAANWAKRLFDIDQFRTVSYPLPRTRVSDADAAEIRRILVEEIPRHAGAASPYHVLTDSSSAAAFQDQAEEISRFQAALAEIRLRAVTSGPRDAETSARVDALFEDYGPAAARLPSVAIELIFLLRDAADWDRVRSFVGQLPPEIRANEIISEQYCLALSELGERERAIADLRQLIEFHGETPERCGLLGGRYKRLYRDARERRLGAAKEALSADERQHLNNAIDWYERGLELDLNEFYCSSNLPLLLRARGRTTDAARADEIESLIIAACVRAEKRGSQDLFLPDTLFGTAFRRGDLAALERIVDVVEAGTPFRLGTTLQDAEDWIDQAPEDARPALLEILARLREASVPRT